MLSTYQHRAATWALALASVASFMVALDALVVTTALSTIRVSLSATIEELEWTVNAYNLSFAVLLMTGAALGDRFGRRRMYVVGLGLFVAASAACALAGNVGWLIAAVIMAITIIGLPWARAAFNIAVYTLLPFGSRAVNRDEVTAPKRARARRGPSSTPAARCPRRTPPTASSGTTASPAGRWWGRCRGR